MISFTYHGVTINLRANESLSGKYRNDISVIWDRNCLCMPQTIEEFIDETG